MKSLVGTRDFLVFVYHIVIRYYQDSSIDVDLFSPGIAHSSSRSAILQLIHEGLSPCHPPIVYDPSIAGGGLIVLHTGPFGNSLA